MMWMRLCVNASVCNKCGAPDQAQVPFFFSFFPAFDWQRLSLGATGPIHDYARLPNAIPVLTLNGCTNWDVESVI